jgi:hypothetical protein
MADADEIIGNQSVLWKAVGVTKLDRISNSGNPAIIGIIP